MSLENWRARWKPSAGTDSNSSVSLLAQSIDSKRLSPMNPDAFLLMLGISSPKFPDMLRLIGAKSYAPGPGENTPDAHAHLRPPSRHAPAAASPWCLPTGRTWTWSSEPTAASRIAGPRCPPTQAAPPRPPRPPAQVDPPRVQAPAFVLRRWAGPAERPERSPALK
eukprot:2527485-Rhodomonas_salina.3